MCGPLFGGSKDRWVGGNNYGTGLTGVMATGQGFAGSTRSTSRLARGAPVMAVMPLFGVNPRG